MSLVASSRELLDAEVKQFVAQHGYEPTGIPVAVDAVALYVHRDNPIQGRLTLDQVDAMFSTTHNRGLKANLSQWGAGSSRRVGRLPSGCMARIGDPGRAFFQEHCLAGGEFAPTLREEPGAASVILDLTRDQLGIGYSGIGAGNLQCADCSARGESKDAICRSPRPQPFPTKRTLFAGCCICISIGPRRLLLPCRAGISDLCHESRRPGKP